MEESRREESVLPISAVFLLAALFLGLFRSEMVPLISSRPERLASPEIPLREELIRARLWQDPLLAMQTNQQIPVPAFEEAAFYPETPEKLIVLMVTVSGGPYAENAEMRLRARYAVISGLATANYVPDNPEHIGVGRFTELGWLLPFERFSYHPAPYQATPPIENDGEKPDVLLLWLNTDLLRDGPLRKVLELKDILLRKFGPAAAFHLIGPPASDTLIAMLMDLRAPELRSPARCEISGDLPSPEGRAVSATLHIWSPWATADEALVLDELERQGFDIDDAIKDVAAIFWACQRIDFTRVNPTDRELAKQLVCELDNRNAIGKDKSVVLVAEWDTFYGRTMPSAFKDQARKMVGEPEACPGGAEIERWTGPESAPTFAYLRGLDGRIPEAGGEQSAQKRDSADTSAEGESLERPEGRSQLDYARRLVRRIKREEQRGQQGEGSDHRSFFEPIKQAVGLESQQSYSVGAIGILGSDVYDKLLLLKALRPSFSTAVFFTTDLDARLLEPAELEWTRNLVVASGFGLQLHSDLQGKIPPFRSTYQTATFLSTLLAVGNVDRGQVAAHQLTPRLYEVGLDGAFDLTPRSADSYLHPTRTDSILQFWQLWALSALFLLFGTILFVPFVTMTRLTWLIGGISAVVLTLIVPISYLFYYSTHYDYDLWEPFALLEGVSIWPTTFARYLVALFCAYALCTCWQSRRENLAALSRRYFGHDATRPNYRWLVLPRTLRANGRNLEAERLWNRYTGRLGLRLGVAKAAAYLVLLFAIIAPVMSILSDRPVVPERGEAAVHWWVLLGSVILLVVLAGFVWDASRDCAKFIRQFAGEDEPIIWPESAIVRRLGELPSLTAENRRLVADWLTIDLIASHTTVVSSFIYYPFIGLAGMILARVRFFDAWNFPVGLGMIFALLAFMPLLAGVGIRHSARLVRQSILNRLKRQLVGRHDETHVRRVERIISQVTQIRQGAFGPLTENPVVGSLLMTAGSVAIVALIDYLAPGQ